VLKQFFEWLYFNENDWYGNPIKIVDVKGINCFLIDENFQRKTVSIVWDWQRYKYMFWIRPIEAMKKIKQKEGK
jgi:hypothetical protein